MLETDCIVPTAFVPIEQPETYKLYGVEHAVDVLRKQGMKNGRFARRCASVTTHGVTQSLKSGKRSVSKTWESEDG